MRILVISDIHGNLPALESVLAAAGSCDQAWNLGDTVGYGPWPDECIGLVKTLPDSVHLSGNHDLAALETISTVGFNPVAAAAAKWTTQRLSPHHREWLASLSASTRADAYVLAHGSPRSPVNEYVMSLTAAMENLGLVEEKGVFVGHTHVPIIAVEGVSSFGDALFRPSHQQAFDISAARFLINPGSVGQPRDRDPRAAYALFDPEAGTIEFRRVAYDVAATQAAIRHANLPSMLADRLALGV